LSDEVSGPLFSILLRISTQELPETSSFKFETQPIWTVCWLDSCQF